MKKLIFYIVFILLIISGCQKKQTEDPIEEKKTKYKSSKILIVHSYSPGPKGDAQKNIGLQSVLDATEVEYKIIYMDTRRNTDEDFRKNAALKAKETIEQYKPDVVITFDDNAFKYLIMPFYKDSELPVVFAGIDWEVSSYGAPYKNTAGMVSVALVLQMLDYIKEYAAGDRIAWLGYDTFTARKETKAYQDILGIDMSTHYVTDFKEWQSKFLSLQTEADMIIHSGMLHTMIDWDEEEAAKFALKNIKVPVGTNAMTLMGSSVFGLVKIASEPGEWAAKTALEIIDGKDPSDIPLTRNKEGKAIINLELAEKLDIVFDAKILKNAEIYQITR